MPGDSTWKQPSVPPRAEQPPGARRRPRGRRRGRPPRPRTRARRAHDVGDDGERAVAEQVDLDEPRRLDAAHLELRDDQPLRRALERQRVGERAVADHDAAGVDREVAREAVERAPRARRSRAPRLALEREAAQLGRAARGVERGRRGARAGGRRGGRPRAGGSPSACATSRTAARAWNVTCVEIIATRSSPYAS